ncbi:hypothetical protein BDB00DRAFT_354293 [Zychaea mexicana]|uniref:uncharacterized protein n=1 Tax=Zychaea mexicana TaxID=64656 RepID=UPI0022FED367|nr:uncharacterized protein BDB00DRAFT_354293 [Zychaea mexicana]KAI9493769.1 hypothetical protein BDB00DRAFT_354293 [Zychaea mexicana]
MANVGTRCFLRMGDDQVENARIVLDFVVMQLQQKTAHSNQVFESIGPDAVYTTRPWALVFVNETQDLTRALRDDFGVSSLEKRQWLESIRVCQVESVHQLKAILCAMHMDDAQPLPVVAGPGPRPSSDLLSWMQTERDNQPPCLIVVNDLLKWTGTGRTSENVLVPWQPCKASMG